MMGSAAVSALAGYLCIFMAHLPQHKFFGYNFDTGKWDPEGKRVAHAILGYFVIIAVVVQSCIGATKYRSETRILTFHGTLGKVVIAAGATTMLLAILFWSWDTLQKVRLIALLILTTIFATISPLPKEVAHTLSMPDCFTEQTDAECQPIVDDTKQA